MLLKRWKRVMWAAGLLLAPCLCFGFQFSSAYSSPRNGERDIRRSTLYIILHTTEAPAGSALPKLRDNGEANFCVDVDGRVYRVVDHRRVAFHCGRSMWDGRSNIDEYSVGIEVVGYHDRDITAAQYQSLGELLRELKFVYRIADDHVLTHSMVAYGAPNRWFSHSHRGRKRCGMLFALAGVRHKLHLMAQPRTDPDVRAGRLTIGDPYLAQVIYSPPAEQTRLIAQGEGAVAATAVASAKSSIWSPSRESSGTEGVQIIGVDGNSAPSIAGDEAWTGTTLYFFRTGRFMRGNSIPVNLRNKLPSGTRMLVGFDLAGLLTAPHRVEEICNGRWRQSDTFFLLPNGVIKCGNDLRDVKIPANSYVFYRS